MQILRETLRYPEVACWSTSGHDSLLLQNIRCCLPIPADPGVVGCCCCCCCWVFFLKDPRRRGGPAPGGSTNPGAGGQSRVRRRVESDLLWGGVTVPGGGTTFGNPCRTLGPVWAGLTAITLPVEALLPLFTLPELPVAPGVRGG